MQHGASGIARAGDDQAIRRRVELLQHGDAGLEAGFGAGLQDHRVHAERGQDVHVGRVERRGQRNAIARIERGEERQRKAAGGADGDRDALERNVQPVPIAIVANDALAQGAAAERLGVAERVAGAQRGHGGGDRTGGCAGAGLADLHADDRWSAGRQRGLAGVGRGDHVHHDEGRRIGAFADLQHQNSNFAATTASVAARIGRNTASGIRTAR